MVRSSRLVSALRADEVDDVPDGHLGLFKVEVVPSASNDVVRQVAKAGHPLTHLRIGHLRPQILLAAAEHHDWTLDHGEVAKHDTKLESGRHVEPEC